MALNLKDDLGILGKAKKAFKQTGDAGQALNDMLIRVNEGKATQEDLSNLMTNIQTGKFFSVDLNQLSPNFHKKEFNQRQKPLGLESFDVSPILIDKLEELRTAIGNKPIRITSGYRTPKYNKMVGGVPKSQHLLGKGSDITVEGMSPTELQKAAKSVNFPFTKKYKTHLHVDVRDLE